MQRSDRSRFCLHRSARKTPMSFKLWAKMRHGSPTIIPVPKWRPRRTLIDLYNERDHTQWFWRMAAIISTLLIMTGYVGP